MRKKVILIIFILHNLNAIYAQKNIWPNQNFSYAKAYMYNLEGNLNASYAIIQNKKLNPTITSEGIILSKDQTTKCINLINSDINGLIEGFSKTFIPHHAIVFFDENDVPLASIMFSFDGEIVRLQPEKPRKAITKELSEKEINNQLKKLEEFRKLIEDAGYPVFDSPFEYQKMNIVPLKTGCIRKLELLENNAIKQLNSIDTRRFDMSGLVACGNKVLAIADKEWNNFIYQIDTSSTNFYLSEFQALEQRQNLDIEGIECYNNTFYLIEEYESEVYKVIQGKPGMEKLEIPWHKVGIGRSDWGNKGFEGLAIDTKEQILYLAKEREDRHVFRVDLKTMEITEPFENQLKNGGGHDISDLKFENGYLYLLERGLGLVTRINVETGEKSSVSFQDFVYHDGQRIFKNNNPQFGMAEALLLKKDEIWIGFDNNGDPVSDYGKTLGLTEGNKTIIIIFKRPLGF